MWMFDLLPEGAFEPRPGGGMRLHGSKGNSAPAPDPRLIEAQIKSMGIQDGAIEGILKLSTEMQPLQREQMQFGIDSSRAAFEQSQADRAYTLNRRGALSGLQDQLVADAKGFSTEARGEELAGQAGADVTQAFSSLKDQNARSMARMGVNPSDGKTAAMGNQLSIAQALGTVSAKASARAMARQEGRALTDRATNALAGYPAMGMQTTGQGAQLAASGLGLATQGAEGMMAGGKSAAAIAGQMGANASQMYGTQSRDYYQQGGGDSMGSILGGLGGLAAGAAKVAPFFKSDRRLKQDIEAVAIHEPTGLTIYEFAYKTDPSRRFHGVMADEVRQVMPEAVRAHPDGFDRVDYARLGIDMVEV